MTAGGTGIRTQAMGTPTTTNIHIYNLQYRIDPWNTTEKRIHNPRVPIFRAQNAIEVKIYFHVPTAFK